MNGTRLIATLPTTKNGEWHLQSVNSGKRSFVVAVHPEHLPQMYEITEGKIYTWELKVVLEDKP